MSPWLLASVQLEPPLRLVAPSRFYALPPRSVSRPLRFAPSSIPVWVERVDPSIPIPNSGSTAETGIKMMFAWKPKALPTLSSEVRRITLPFIRPRFHNICSLNFQERQLHDFFSTFLFSLSFFLFLFFLVESPFLNAWKKLYNFSFFFVSFAFF